jgi:prepilin-type N-terminal cleavage/methylation domain-containing protein
MKTARLSSKAMKAFGRGSPGFTLIEVLVALGLFAIIGIVFAGGLATASRAVITADVRTNAESLARTQMESVKEQDYEPAPDGGVYNYTKIPDIPPGYTIWTVNRDDEIVNGGDSDPVIGVPWDSESNVDTPEDNGLQKITLVIMHEGRRVLTLEGYKVYR